MPPTAVMTPQTMPRSQGEPRPVICPSSESASVRPMEMPAPTDAAMPTRKVSQLFWVAKAAAKRGAGAEEGAGAGGRARAERKVPRVVGGGGGGGGGGRGGRARAGDGARQSRLH